MLCLCWCFKHNILRIKKVFQNQKFFKMELIRGNLFAEYRGKRYKCIFKKDTESIFNKKTGKNIKPLYYEVHNEKGLVRKGVVDTVNLYINENAVRHVLTKCYKDNFI